MIQQDVKFIPYRFEIRWGFDYQDGRQRFGEWTRPGGTEATRAYSQDLKTANMAFIEVKNRETREILRIAGCLIRDYVRFQWVSTVPVGFKEESGMMKVQTGTYSGSVQGLTLVTTDKKFTQYIDGSCKMEETGGANAVH
jgi:hypothetical protein